MIRRILLLTAVFSVIGATAAVAAPPTGITEEAIGKVVFQRTPPAVDRAIRKEIDRIAARLKKISGRKAIKLEGDFSAATNEEEYCNKSMFMAKEVQRYLHDQHVKLESFVATRKFTAPAKADGNNVVRVLLIPNSFSVEKIHYDRIPAKLFNAVDRPVAANEVTREKLPIAEPPRIINKKTPEELAAEKKAAEDRRVADQQLAEDVRQADDLVAKVKARAAERAKKLAEMEKASSQSGEISKSP